VWIVDDVRQDNHVKVVEPWIWLVLKADTGGALAGTGLVLLAVAGRLLSELDGVVARKTAGNACSSPMLGRACSSVKLAEAGE
jgi:hypothetical protein